MKNILDLTNVSPFGMGANGDYYRYTGKVGLKVTSLAPMEFEWLKALNKILPGVFPKAYKRCKVTYDGTTKEAYTMEHIDGQRLSDLIDDDREMDKCDKLTNIIDKFVYLGIYWSDLHSQNVIVDKRGRFRLIDCDPRYFRIRKNLLDKLPKSVRLFMKEWSD